MNLSITITVAFGFRLLWWRTSWLRICRWSSMSGESLKASSFAFARLRLVLWRKDEHRPSKKCVLVSTRRTKASTYGLAPQWLRVVYNIEVLRLIVVTNVSIGHGDYMISCVRVGKIVDHLEVRSQLSWLARSTRGAKACLGSEGDPVGISVKKGNIHMAAH